MYGHSSWSDVRHSPNERFLGEDDGIVSGQPLHRIVSISRVLLPEGARQRPCPQSESHRGRERECERVLPILHSTLT